MIKEEIYSKKFALFFFVLMLIVYSNSFAQNAVVDSVQIEPRITFLELGSTTCIPCKMMKPVLKSIREKYGDQIEVIFHDVKKDRKIAEKYNIRIIPTQIFLDKNGQEIHRHVGFYTEDEIDEFLKVQGLKIIQQKEKK